MSQDFNYVGKRVPFIASEEKVTGKVKYSYDKYKQGALFGKVLMSPYAHARILSIDTSKAKALPGVATVVTYDDVPKIKVNPAIVKWSHNFSPMDREDMYIIREKARYVGDVIAAVAAVDEKTADEAISLIEVDYEVLPAAVTLKEAMAPGAPLIHEDLDSNVSQEWDFPGNRGDVDKVWNEDSEVVVEDRVKTSRQYLMPLEPLTCTARFEPNGELTVWTPNQRVFMMRKQLGELFELPEGSVNMVCDYAGGGFGEGNWPIIPIAVLLARKAGKTVRLEYPRETFVLGTNAREVYDVWGKMGFSKDGILLAGAVELTVESGAYFNRSHATTGPTMGGFQGLYRMPATRCSMKAVYTNAPMSGGSRGYGNPQAVLVCEHLFDLAAGKLGIDPLELRCMNMKRMGEFAIQYPFETETQEKVLRLAAEKMGYEEKRRREKADGIYRRGIGMANYMDVSGGQPKEIMDRHCVMTLEEDGTVVVTQNHPDFGMNLLGSCTQIAAEALGIRYEDFRHIHGSTKGAMYDVGLGANSGLYGMGNLYYKCALEVKERILEIASEFLDCAADGLDIKDSVIFVKDDPSKHIGVKEFADRIVNCAERPSRYISVHMSHRPDANPSAIGTVFADICVDTETGEIKVEKLLIVHDCGRAINPNMVEGQLAGAMLTGLGLAMFEDPAIDSDGVAHGTNYNTYKIASTLDMPELDVNLYEDEPPESGPYGAKATGMSGIIGVTGAIANALYDATGVWLDEMPFTPERVLAALRKQG